MQTILARPLEEESFAPYGAIVDGIINHAKPTEDDARLMTWIKGADLPSFYGDGLAVYLITKHREFVVEQMEVHRECAPLIVPISGTAIIPVAPSNDIGGPDIEKIAVFILEQGQAIVLYPGIWFVVPYPFGKRARYIFVIRKSTPTKDTELQTIEPLLIKFESSFS